jgi:hypothetical protein
LKKQLTWADFQGSKPANSTFAAATKSTFIVSQPVLDPRTHQLTDSVTVTVVFDNKASWVDPTMNQSTAQLQQELLDHEQGHYNITALVARDLFIRLMSLKGRMYANRVDLVNDYNGWINIFINKVNSIQTAYDGETGHSQAGVFVPSTNLFTPPHQKGAPQTKWEGLIAQAFITPRPGGGSAPDGTPYKVQLDDVLVGAGIQL